MKTKVLVAILSIAVLEGIALWQGMNGAIFGVAIAAIAGLGGFTIGHVTKPK